MTELEYLRQFAGCCYILSYSYGVPVVGVPCCAFIRCAKTTLSSEGSKDVADGPML